MALWWKSFILTLKCTYGCLVVKKVPWLWKRHCQKVYENISDRTPERRSSNFQNGPWYNTYIKVRFREFGLLFIVYEVIKAYIPTSTNN